MPLTMTFILSILNKIKKDKKNSPNGVRLSHSIFKHQAVAKEINSCVCYFFSPDHINKLLKAVFSLISFKGIYA